MRRRLQEEEEQGGAPGWMVSYADLTQLLLTFFILLFALSSIDAHKFRQAVISLQGALGVLPSGTGVLDVGDVPPTPRSFRPDEYGAARRLPWKWSETRSSHTFPVRP